jgi:hypothetical protein
MSELSGNLQDFPLPDVLRLLSKGKKNGVLHLYGDEHRGRVYLDDGRISYATTRSGDEFADADGPTPIGSGERQRIDLGEIKDQNPEKFQDHLKSQIVEVLVRLGRETEGSFVFQNGVTPAEPVKEPFLVDEILGDAEAELKEWTRIEGIIGTTSTPMTMVRSMPANTTITIDGMAWNALAVMSGSGSARKIANQLNQFEIVAARALARLVEQGLVEPAADIAGSDAARFESEPEQVQEADFSEIETKAVLSALTGGSVAGEDTAPEPVRLVGEHEAADDGGGDEHGRENDGDEDDGWAGLDDPEPAPEPTAGDIFDNVQPPASELARRWRSLRSGAND